MSYSIDLIDNGFLLQKNEPGMSWADEPTRSAFLNWDELVEYLKNNKLEKPLKEDKVVN